MGRLGNAWGKQLPSIQRVSTKSQRQSLTGLIPGTVDGQWGWNVQGTLESDLDTNLILII